MCTCVKRKKGGRGRGMCTEGLGTEVEVRSSVVLQKKGNYGERKKTSELMKGLGEKGQSVECLSDIYVREQQGT